MLSRKSPPSLLSALCVLLACSAQKAAAGPFPRDDLHAAGYGYLMIRNCNQYCGMDNQYCCSAGETCYTSNGIAGCSVGGNGGGYAVVTTTWTSTGTYTSTYSTFFPAATTGSGKCIPPAGSGQKACGSICCASWQYCAKEGQCAADPSAVPGGTTAVSSGPGGAITTGFIAPYRPTTVTGGVTTGTADGASTTSGGVAPGGTAGGGLSPGAIAGIVIGTLAGIVLLLLICACCIVRGLWHGALAILGIGKKKEKTTVIEEERYRSGSRHSRRDNHGSWYGGAAGRPSTVASRKEKKSSGKGLLGLGAALGTLWLLLGLKKSKDKKKGGAKTRSDVSSSYWSSSSYTADSPSSMSSDRRTRRSRQSRTGSRTSRMTRTTRVSRVPSQRSPRGSPRSPPR